MIRIGGHALALAAALGLATGCGRDVSDRRQGPQSAGSGLLDQDYPGCRSPHPATARSEIPAGLVDGLAARAPAALAPRIVAQRNTASGDHYDVRYFDREGHPVCGQLATAHVVQGHVWVDGEPSLPVDAVEPTDWPTLEDAASTVAGELKGKTAHVTKAEACVQVDRTAAALSAAWDVFVTIDGRPYHAVASKDRIFRLESLAFHLTEEAKVYDASPLGKLTSYSLTGMTADGRLDDGRLHTSLANDDAPAVAVGGRFDFAPEDPRFAETSVFVHARRMIEWQLQPQHGFSLECPPLALDLHFVFKPEDGGVNNAQYFPPDANDDGLPHVKIADGDGLVLKNLPLDFDVVGHELGHNVVYRRLKTFSGESLVLHEGLADALLFSMTGNPCLGESVCPVGSTACAVQGQCLRTADNTLRMDDPGLSLEAHRRSQVVSGLLWDLTKKPGYGTDLIGNLIFRAVEYLLPASGYHDLIKGLLSADLELHQGTHRCAILEAARARGFGDEIQDLTCEETP